MAYRISWWLLFVGWVLLMIASFGPMFQREELVMQDDLLNVLDLGADPSGTHDATEAFRQALEKSGTVFVPQGIYKLSGLIIGETPPSEIVLPSDGPEKADGQ